MSDRIRLALLVLVLVAFVVRPRRRWPSAPPPVRSERRRARPTSSRYARRLLGVRYRYGGTSPRSGFDCSGFTRFVYAHFGIALPHYSDAQFGLGRRVARAGCSPAISSSSTGSATSASMSAAGASSTRRTPARRVSVEPLERLVLEPLRRRAPTVCGSPRDYHGTPAERLVRPDAMDRPVLHTLVERLRARGAAAGIRGGAADARPRLGAGAAARARGAARGARARRSSRSSPTTPTRATPPRRPPGSSARTRSRCSRPAACAGAPASSRRRTSSASGRARSRCSRAAGSSARPRPRVAEGLPPRRASGPRRSRSRAATSPGIESLAEQLALAGLRAGRARRGARAVRRSRRPGRRLPDDRPRAAARRALRRRDRADPRLLAVHAARAARRSRTATSTRPAERRRELVEIDLARRRGRGAPAARCPTTSCRRSTARPTSSGQPDEVRAGLGRGGARTDRRSTGATELTPLPAGPAVLVRRAAAGDRRARALRGRERARRPAAAGARHRRRVPAPRRGAAPAGAAAPQSARTMLEPGDEPEGLAFAVSPARRGLRLARPRLRAAPRHAGLPQAAAARDRARPAARCRASPTCAPATTSCTRTTASRS